MPACMHVCVSVHAHACIYILVHVYMQVLQYAEYPCTLHVIVPAISLLTGQSDKYLAKKNHYKATIPGLDFLLSRTKAK